MSPFSPPPPDSGDTGSGPSLPDHLRVSLTDACDLRCTHCLPENAPFKLRSRLLRDEELLRLLRLFAGVGFHHIHFAGGEPTLRSSLVEIIRETVGLPGITRVSLATDGRQFPDFARALRSAGLHAVHFSVANLAPDGFGRLATRPLTDLLAAARLAGRVGLETALNCRLARTPGHRTDLAALVRLTLKHAVHVRLIDEGAARGESRRDHIGPLGGPEMCDLIERKWGPLATEPVPAGPDRTRLRVSGARGTLAFVDATAEPFCDSCNRLRLSAEGDLRLCSLPGAEVQLRMLMHQGAADSALRDAILRAVRLMPPAAAGSPGPRRTCGAADAGARLA